MSDSDRDRYGVCLICGDRYERIVNFYDDNGLCSFCEEQQDGW